MRVFLVVIMFLLLYNILVLSSRATRKLGTLAPESNTYKSWYYACSSLIQICVLRAAYSIFFLLQKCWKTGHQWLYLKSLKFVLYSFILGLNQSKYRWPLSHITLSSNFHIKYTNVFGCMATSFDLVPFKGIAWKQSFSNHATRSAT